MPYTVHHKISELIIKHLRGELTIEERTELDEWMASSPENKLLYDELTTEEALAKEVKSLPEIKTRILKAIYKNLPSVRPVIPMYRRPAFRWIAAACIILLLGLATYTVISKRSEKSPATEVAKTNDVPAPKETRAVITLADGRKVYLDSTGNGTIAQENNVAVVKNSEGGISYMSPAGGANSEQRTANSPTYNTLFNPRGSKVISLTLSDGSHVWLNAGSSVKYPVAFVGNDRKVEITGEAYFEVAHDASKPFHVIKGETDITVLGTHFNVNAYDDEESLKVTLLEGSVKVSVTDKSVTIKPGEQAQMNGGNAIGLVVNRGVDVDQVMAWKNGLFDFDGADLQTIMRQIARWYDVEVIYQGNVTKEAFKGEINRTVPVSKVLQMLEYLGMKFKVEGRKITVAN